MKIKEVIIGLSGLMFLLTACEKDRAEMGAGKKVEVLFSASSAGYDSSEEALRSIKNRKPEAVIVPLDDDIYLSMSLEPDTIDEIRAAVFLNDKQKIRFSAFNGTTLVAGPVTYTYSTGTGKFTPDGGAPLGVDPNGTNYRFVAHSYFGDPTATPAESGIAPAKDLVWGAANKVIPNTYAGRDVDITMAHLFSRVRVRINTGTIATAMKNITNVQILGGKTASFSSLWDGTLAEGSAVTQTVTGFSGTGTTQESNQYVFYKSPTQVTIGSLTLTIGGVERVFSNITANFTATLAAASNYVLVLDLKARRFAWSNIYFDGENMTFDTTDQGHELYQGIFFKWGSLVGIGPDYNNNSNLGTSPTLNVYVPDGSSWAIDTYAWSAIPYTDPSAGTVGAPSISTLKGDICTYINSAYRLPRNGEFAEFTAQANWTANPKDWTIGGTDSAMRGNVTGTDPMAFYATYAVGNVRFPAGGCHYRDGNNVWYRYVNGAGYYWTNSAVDATRAYFLAFNSVTLFPSHINIATTIEHALTVRCIKN